MMRILGIVVRILVSITTENHYNFVVTQPLEFFKSINPFQTNVKLSFVGITTCRRWSSATNWAQYFTCIFENTMISKCPKYFLTFANKEKILTSFVVEACLWLITRILSFSASPIFMPNGTKTSLKNHFNRLNLLSIIF